MIRLCPFCEGLSSEKVGEGTCEKCRQEMFIFYCRDCKKKFFSCNHLYEKYILLDSPLSKRGNHARDSAGASD